MVPVGQYGLVGLLIVDVGAVAAAHVADGHEGRLDVDERMHPARLHRIDHDVVLGAAADGALLGLQFDLPALAGGIQHDQFGHVGRAMGSRMAGA